MKFKTSKNNRWAMAAIAVAALFATNAGIAQAGRLISPLPPVIIGYETTPVKMEYPEISPTPVPDPNILPPPPIQNLD
jgi:hypothetical protein